MKLDCIIEVTAQFFYPGDQVSAADLGDFVCWSGNSDIEALTAEIEVGDEVKLAYPTDATAVGSDLRVFTVPATGFTYTFVSEGRSDCGAYSCGLEYEREHFEDDWFIEFHEEWTAEANKIWDERHPPRHPDVSPLRRVKWLVAGGFWSNHAEGDLDCGVELYGRLRLDGLSRLLSYESSLAASK